MISFEKQKPSAFWLHASHALVSFSSLIWLLDISSFTHFTAKCDIFYQSCVSREFVLLLSAVLASALCRAELLPFAPPLFPSIRVSRLWFIRGTLKSTVYSAFYRSILTLVLSLMLFCTLGVTVLNYTWSFLLSVEFFNPVSAVFAIFFSLRTWAVLFYLLFVCEMFVGLSHTFVSCIMTEYARLSSLELVQAGYALPKVPALAKRALSSMWIVKAAEALSMTLHARHPIFEDFFGLVMFEIRRGFDRVGSSAVAAARASVQNSGPNASARAPIGIVTTPDKFLKDSLSRVQPRTSRKMFTAKRPPARRGLDFIWAAALRLTDFCVGKVVPRVLQNERVRQSAVLDPSTYADLPLAFSIRTSCSLVETAFREGVDFADALNQLVTLICAIQGALETLLLAKSPAADFRKNILWCVCEESLFRLVKTCGKSIVKFPYAPEYASRLQTYLDQF
eukprot:ANDGO_04825.mRNA.1 hypothetical protein